MNIKLMIVSLLVTMLSLNAYAKPHDHAHGSSQNHKEGDKHHKHHKHKQGCAQYDKTHGKNHKPNREHDVKCHKKGHNHNHKK